MKTRRIVLIFSLILCLGMLVACNADVAEQNAGDKLAYATFKNDSKDFSVSYDGYKSFDDLYWYYKANKLDAYGQSGDTGTFYAKVPGDSEGKGLDGKTEALSEGKWQFTLMAFETALPETTTSGRYDAEHASQSAIYSGYTPASGEDVIVIRRNQTNYIPVTVTPVAGNGHIKFANAYYEWETAGSVSNPDVKITITIPVTFDDNPIVITKTLEYATANYPISGYIWLNGLEGTIDDEAQGEGYTNDIPAGVYAASIVITPVNDEDNIIFASQNLSLKVFGGLTATISGSLKELLSYENYFAVPEVDVQVFNPKTTGETPITSDYVAKDDKTTESTTVTFPEGALTSTNQHSLEIEVFSAAVSESKFVISGASKAVAGLDLTLKKVTRTSEGDVKEETVSEFDNNKYATIVTYINPGLEDVAVKYNGNDKDQPIATDEEVSDKTKAKELSSDSGLGYNPATGYLSFKTNHFSEYYVQAKVYVQNVTTGKYYHSLKAAVDDAKDNQTIKLLDDIELTNTLETSKSFELDLNGENISANNCRALLIKEGIVSIFGNGTISANGTELNPDSSVIRLGSPTSVSNAAKLTIGAAVTVSSNKSYGITVFGKNVNASSLGQELIVDGKVTVTGQNPAISGNGSSGLSKTKITINEGAVVSSTGADANNRGSAIYHPQAGTLLINGGTVSGPSAIEAKGGDVTIIGGAIIATASSLVHDNNSNGNSTAGYSIVAVKNGDYKGDGNYVISSGTFTGCVDVVEDSAAEFTPTISITGGIFDYNPSVYVADGYVAEALGTTPETWGVVPTTPQVSVVMDGESECVTMSLASFRNKVNAGNSYAGYTVTLLCDVDLEGIEWTPLKVFAGTFDGNNKTLSGLKLNVTNTTSDDVYIGFFEKTENATIKNLTISEFEIYGSGRIASGTLVGNASNGLTLRGVTLTSTNKLSGKWSGGFIGKTSVTKDGSENRDCKYIIDDCHSSVEIVGERTGGFIGQMDGSNNSVYRSSNGFAIFTSCSFNGKLNANTGTAMAGGFIAQATNSDRTWFVYSYQDCSVYNSNISSIANLGDFTAVSQSAYSILNCKINDQNISLPTQVHFAFCNSPTVYAYSINGTIYAIKASSSGYYNITSDTIGTDVNVAGSSDHNISLDDVTDWHKVTNAYTDFYGNYIVTADASVIYRSVPSHLEDGTKLQRRTYVAGHDYSAHQYTYSFDMWRIVNNNVAPEGTGFGQWQDVGSDGAAGFVLGAGIYYYFDPTAFVDQNTYSVSSHETSDGWKYYVVTGK